MLSGRSLPVVGMTTPPIVIGALGSTNLQSDIVNLQSAIVCQFRGSEVQKFKGCILWKGQDDAQEHKKSSPRGA